MVLTADAIILESGDQEPRASYAEHHLGEDIAFARAVKSERGPLTVKVVGDVACVSGLSTARGEFNGRAINSSGAELIVLMRRSVRGREGSWTITAIHWSSHGRT